MIDNAIYIDGKRAIAPLDDTFEELRTCTDTPGHGFCWIGLLRPSKSEIERARARPGRAPEAAVPGTFSPS